MIEKYQLYILIAIMLFSAMGVVGVKNVFHCALLLGLALLSIAGIYLLLGAEFLAAVQMFVYIGGILTLIIFAIMFTKNLSDKNIRQTNQQKPTAFFISAFILVAMVAAILKTPLPEHVGVSKITDTASIGRVFFLDYVLAFEILSIILLVALVGAITLAKKETKNDAH
ncbi:MAG: NADH-quinone oxidoreductase subunit J [Candidatus Omnitrophota bacterium]|nr:NADH-quinone oxidoreductase subunit J [Candidatus Omnitrophota bacterium]